MTHNNRVRLSKLSLGLIVALAAAPVFAQSTSAGVGGRILGADGQPVTGAVVTITHTESGTVSRVTTDAAGRYNARGLRVGGPYTITVNKAGAGSTSRENVYLALDNVSQVDAQLRDDVATLESVQVVASRGADIFSPDSMGTGTNLNREQIESFASIQRNIQDYARLDPRISQTDKERGEISAAGQNTRFNSVTIDRVSTNDSFGLESNNLPTLKQPISLDAIEEVQVNVANYDVSQKGYTGANINAVTKSGTNNFDGSVYYIFRKADWVGENEDGDDFTGFKDEKTYGLTLGGPIVKDKLFFFASYEKFRRTAPGPDFGPLGSGLSNEYDDLTVGDVNEVIGAARDLYGMEAGGSSAPNQLNTEVEDKLIKLDWNINDSHRASLRYNKTEQSEAILPNLDNDEYSLSSHWYNQVKTFESAVGQLFSDWTDNFSTEVSLSYRDYHSEPDTFSRLPQVIIDFGDTNLHFGREQFRHANVLDTQTLNAFVAGNWYLGDHELKFGVDYDKNDIYNLFVESSLGAYFFDGLENFQNGVYRDYAVRKAAPGQNPAAEFTLENLGLFVQDTWTATDNLTLTFGLRYDTPIIDDKPIYNDTASTHFGYRNDVTIDGNSLLQPRFGFNYTFNSDRRTQLRGGVGLFQGSAANVWLSNPFTNNGRTIDVFGCGFGFSVDCDEVVGGAPPFEPNPDNQPEIGDAPAADVDIIDPSLEQPSVWKANLAFDHELPWWGMVFTAEALFTSVDTAIYYEHLNLGAPTGVAPDGRLLYWGSTDPSEYNASRDSFNGGSRENADSRFREVLLARPTSKGEGQSFTLSLQKPMTDQWFWQVAYTFANATEVSPLTSSRAISNWNGRAVYNPNEEVSSTSNYLIGDRFTAALSYRPAFFDGYKTEFSVFYEGRKGKPYSWTYDNDANGDGIAGNDLLYVPNGPGDVEWLDAGDEAAFFEYVNANPRLARYYGSVPERNTEHSPWVNTFDVRISQELPGFFGDNKAELWVDILNFGNLLNKDWGHTEEIGFPLNRGVVDFAGINPETGKYVYDFNGTDELRRRDATGESRWSLQVGFRYKF